MPFTTIVASLSNAVEFGYHALLMKALKNALRKYLVAGVLVLAPVALTVWLLQIMIGAADALLEIKNGRFFYFVPADYHPERLLGVRIPGMGVVASILLLLMVGVVAHNFFGRKLIHLGERIVKRIPFVRTIYNAAKQLLETVLHQNSRNFKDVVLYEYPRKGIYTIAFISGESIELNKNGEIQRLVGLFLPTTPNPTSGYYMLVPEKDVSRLDISPEEAFKLIISFGIVVPEKLRHLVFRSKAGNP